MRSLQERVTNLGRHITSGTLFARLRHGPGLGQRLRHIPDAEITNWSVRRLNSVKRLLPHCDLYLEVGVASGNTFQSVDVPERWGVDPYPAFDIANLPPNTKFFRSDSDAFFGSLDERVLFDLVFLDGLHTFEQTYIDLLNVLKHSHSRTVILVDDTHPSDEISSIPSMSESHKQRKKSQDPSLAWHGDVFKLLPVIERYHPELVVCPVSSSRLRTNTQTFVWRRQEHPEVAYSSDIPREVLDFSTKINFRNSFESSPPRKVFQPVEEDEALERIRISLGL